MNIEWGRYLYVCKVINILEASNGVASIPFGIMQVWGDG